MKAPLPHNEAERLGTLHQYGVLDTVPEEAFDDLALLAAHICHVPMAMVSLIDENRQWFKSKMGLESVEMPRDIAFCAHTILDASKVMEVRDTQADPRFADNPLVTADPHIRFYAGAPLIAPNGHALGALCVIDLIPRTLTAQEIAALSALSRRVVAQLELRKQARKLAAGELETKRLLAEAEKSRHALLSVLEDQKHADTALRSSEERFRQVVENIHEIFWMTDVAKQETLYVSPRYEAVWGRSCASLYASPQSWAESVYEPDRERVLHAAATKQLTGDYDETYRIVRPDGSLRWIRSRTFPVRDRTGVITRVVGVAEDITTHKHMEEQFLRAQRLESIGMLAAGIAHDLNNVLAPIGMVAPMLRHHSSLPSDLRLLDTLEKCAERGASLVRQILGFVHGVSGEPRLVQVKHLLHDIIEVITETFPKSITLDGNAPGNLWPIMANPTQIHQVLLNLCVNARDAMPHGGTLRLNAENVSLDEALARAIEGGKPGDWLMLEIEDTGSGIPPEVLARIWEPFFTTKAADKGTGLGLSTVRGIVETHHGFITLQSELGRGTLFRVYLPAAESAPAGLTKVTEPPFGRGHGELILVVDDEKLIRDAVSAILNHVGYRVITAVDGADAAALFEKQAAEISLVITDHDMPVLDGEGLTHIIHTLNPAMKVLTMSGLGPSAQNRSGTSGREKISFLPKPFSAQTLLDCVEKILRSNPTPR